MPRPKATRPPRQGAAPAASGTEHASGAPGLFSARHARAWIVGLTVLAYLNSFAGDFVFDDVHEIVHNPSLERLLPPWEAMFKGHKAPARPLPYLSFAIDRALWGCKPFGFHVTNVAVHLAAALALFDLIRLTLLSPRLRDRWGQGAVPLALASTVLWAVHPLNTQAVTYIYQRIEAMAGMFCLMSLAAFATAAAAEWSWKWLAASAAACFAAMACKESAVVLPVLLLSYDWLFTPAVSPANWLADAWQRRRFFYAACFLSWLVLGAVVASQAGDYTEFGATRGSALTQPGVIMHYMRLSFWPAGLCLDYSGWPAVTSFSLRQLPAYAAIVALVVTTAVGTWRRRPWAWLGLTFFGCLAPTSSVLPVEAFVNEHRMYLPLAALVATVVCGAATIRMRGRAGLIATLVVAIVLIAATRSRNRLYYSGVAIWNDVLEKDPGNYRGLWQMADLLDHLGQEADAFALADRAVERKPTCEIYGNLAAARLATGDHSGAERRCRRGLERQVGRLPPDDRAVLISTGDLAAVLRLGGKVAEAASLCTGTIDDMRRVLGADHVTTIRSGQIIAEGLSADGDHAAAEAEAREQLRRATDAKPAADPLVINATLTLARVLDAAGRTAEAELVVRALLQSLQQDSRRRKSDTLVLETMRAELQQKLGRSGEAVDAGRRMVDDPARAEGRD